MLFGKLINCRLLTEYGVADFMKSYEQPMNIQPRHSIFLINTAICTRYTILYSYHTSAKPYAYLPPGSSYASLPPPKTSSPIPVLKTISLALGLEHLDTNLRRPGNRLKSKNWGITIMNVQPSFHTGCLTMRMAASLAVPEQRIPVSMQVILIIWHTTVISYRHR